MSLRNTLEGLVRQRSNGLRKVNYSSMMDAKTMLTALPAVDTFLVTPYTMLLFAASRVVPSNAIWQFVSYSGMVVRKRSVPNDQPIPSTLWLPLGRLQGCWSSESNTRN